jgi:quinol-cytochrome oxidoreductase complex cytochrome b subunit
MLTDRIISAFTFRREVYKEVERDTTFTQIAWLLVVVVAFLEQLGSNASRSVGSWLIGTVVGTIVAVIAFAVGAFVINWVGRTVFNADVTFDELVRTLGLAYVWHVVGVIGVLTAFSDTLGCLLAPVAIIAAIMGLLSWLVAMKEALDLEWVQTIVTVILGWLAVFVVTFIAAAVLGMVGLTIAAVGGLIGG